MDACTKQKVLEDNHWGSIYTIPHEGWVCSINGKWVIKHLQIALQLEHINACRMYLQITTLAEMTDNTGMYVLPQVLNIRGQAHPSGLESISSSTLKWPRVGNLTTTTWNFWT